jgi:DNA damage-binding protein 1
MGAPVSSLFNLRSSASAELADTLVVSFVSSTRIFVFDAEGEVEEVESFHGFDLTETTLYAGNLADGRAVQVTSSAVLLTDAESGMVTDTWQSPEGTSITSVAANLDTILVSLKGAALVVLDVSGSGISVGAKREFSSDEQVSCVTLSSTVPNTCVVGFWQDSKVSFLDLQTLQAVATEQVAEEDTLAVPRSLAIANILPNSPPTLFVGLADGNVVTYSIESQSKLFAARKSIILGTQQANFTTLSREDGLENVLAICEHPSLVYSSEGRMVYSAVTAEDATCVSSFDSAAYPGAIAIATADTGELKLAVVDQERTTHVETLAVNETVRRIAYSSSLKAFGLGTIKRTLKAGVEEVQSHFKLVDEVVFQELHTFALNTDELIESCMRCELNDGADGLAERFVVGTAYLDEDSAESARGRILIFEVTESRQLKLVAEQALRGACRCLSMCQGNIVAALIKTVSTTSCQIHYNILTPS